MPALRAPPPTSEATTHTMKANKGKDTGPEVRVRRMLRGMGYPGYRLNWKKAPGKPDIAYPGHKLAIFVNGCFWHRCPVCNLPLPKSHAEYWEEKFRRNVERDAEKTRELKGSGWQVVVIWECRLRNEPESVGEELKGILDALYGVPRDSSGDGAADMPGRRGPRRGLRAL